MPDLSLSRSKENIAALGVPCGTMLPFGGDTAPDGYLICDGSSLNRGDYPELFAAIGTAWGTASGSTFNLPNTRGLMLKGIANGSSNDPDRASRTFSASGGNTGDNIGSYQYDYSRLPRQVAFNTGTQSANHTHTRPSAVVNGSGVGGNGGNWVTGFGNRNTGGNSTSHDHTINTGGDQQTTGRNVYVNYIIKI